MTPSITEAELLVVAAFSRQADALQWGQEELKKVFGPIALSSEQYLFHHTAYYEATMGPSLVKQFCAFEQTVAAAALASIKRQTIEMENDLAASRRFAEPRPLNLDPGLLSLGKFVLATTKNQSHRIYLRDGIFAEVTLRFQEQEFTPWPWTYADYREPAVLAFLKDARAYYKRIRKG